ncbi:MAG: pentapeptide repeat-containing protein [Deinococcales bacterium]
MSTEPIESGRHYRDTAFRGLRLSTGVEGCTFVGCTFDDSHLREIAFRDCRVLACAFVACDLSLVDVGGSAFRDVSFDACNLTGVNWSRATATLHDPLEIDFRDCILDFGVFQGCALEGRRLDHCVAHECDFRNTVLEGAVCRGTDFAGSNFDGADLRGADLRKARDYAIDVRTTQVKGARFSLPDAVALLRGLEIELD